MTLSFSEFDETLESIHKEPSSKAGSVAPLTAAQMQAFGTAVIDGILAQVLFAFANIRLGSGTVGQAFPQLQTYANELQADASNALATAEGAQTTANTANTTANTALANWTTLFTDLGTSTSTASELATFLTNANTNATNASNNWNTVLTNLSQSDATAFSTFISSIQGNASGASGNWSTLLSALSQANATALASFIANANTAAQAAYNNWDTFFTDIGLSVTTASQLASFLSGLNTTASNANTTASTTNGWWSDLMSELGLSGSGSKGTAVGGAISSAASTAAGASSAASAAQSTANTASTNASTAQSTANTNTTTTNSLLTSLFGSPAVAGITTIESDIANFISNGISGGAAPTSANSPVAFLEGLFGLSGIPHTSVAIPPSPATTAMVTRDAHVNATPVQNGSGSGPQTLSWYHTCAAAANYLTVRLGSYVSNASAVTVTYNGIQMQPLVTGEGPDSETYTQIYGLANPPTGASYEIIVTAQTFFGQIRIAAGCSDSYIQVGALGTIASTDGSGSNPALTLAAGTGNYVVGAVAVSAGTAVTLSGISGTTEYNSGSLTSSAADLAFAANDAAGAATVTVGATASTRTNNWAACAVTLVPLSTGTMGSGFRVYRASTTAVNVVAASGYTEVMPASFYDTDTGANTVVTSDYTWVPSTSTLTVQEAGHYHIVVNFEVSSTITAGVRVAAALYHQGVLVRVGPTANGPPTGTMAAGTLVGMAWNLYLNAGDYIQPGVYTTGAATTAAGESTGSQTYFEASLSNRSLA